MDLEFARRTHHAAYHGVVVRQFGSWDREMQDRFFQQGWTRAPHQIVLLHGRSIGVISVENLDDHIFIHEIQILPEFQKKGIGSRILGDQLAKARQVGKLVKLKVLRGNEARRLYERYGFVCCEESEIDYKMVWQPREKI
jgi:GNAT superfamily N-acetyltransferase